MKNYLLLLFSVLFWSNLIAQSPPSQACPSYLQLKGNGYVNISSVADDINSSTGFTFQGWVKGIDLVTGMVLKIVDANRNNIFEVMITSGTARISSGSPLNYLITTEAIFNDRTWYNIAVVYKSTNEIELYVDGVLIDQATQELILSDTDQWILGASMANSGNTSSKFKGLMEDITIADYARSVAEITDYMQGTAINTGTNLVANYNFSGTSNDSILDVSLLGNNGSFEEDLNIESRVYSDLYEEYIDITLGDSVLIGDDYQYFTGTYEYTYQTNQSCDSTVTTYLTSTGTPPFDDCDKVIEFNGNNRRFTIVDVEEQFAALDSFTIEFWFKTPRNASQTFLVFDENLLDRNNLWLSMFQGNIRLTDANGGYIITSLSYDDNIWHHLALTWVNGPNEKTVLFIDGNSVGSSTSFSPFFNTDDRITFGAQDDNGYEDFFKGQLSQIAMWDYPFDSARVMESVKQKLDGNEDGLFVYYDIKESLKEKVIHNLAGDDYDAQLTNGNQFNSSIGINGETVVKTSIDGANLVADKTEGTFQWIDCTTNTPIDGATGKEFEPTVNGSYSVVHTLNECSDTSACRDFMTVSVNESINDIGLQLYPNPVGNTIHFNGLVFGDLTYQATILDTKGQTILAQSIENASLNIEALSPGTYLIKVLSSDQKTYSGRFVKIQ